MSRKDASSHREGSSPASQATPTRLHGRLARACRVVWMALVTFVLGFFVLGLPEDVARVSTVGKNPGDVPWQLSPEGFHALQNAGISLSVYAPFALALSTAIMLVWVVVGVVIFWRKSDDWMALLVAFMLVNWGLDTLAATSTLYPENLASQAVGFLLNASVILFFFLFPDGRFVPGWTWWLALIAITLEAGIRFLSANSPWNPNNWPAPISSLLLLSFFFTIAAGQLYRYRRVATAVQREQIKWVVFALTLVVSGMVGDVVVEDLLKLHLPILFTQFLGPVTWTLVPVLIPISIGFAILHYRLWDIDLIINRTLVYGVLTVSIVAFYILVVVGLGSVLQTQGNPGIALLATGLVAVLFQPWRTWLQRAVNRLMYRERDDPYRVLSRLGQRLEATLAPDAVLPTIVETVAQALKLPYAAITLKRGDELTPAVSYGASQGELVRLPLVYQTERVGEMILAPRTPGESFTPIFRDVKAQASLIKP